MDKQARLAGWFVVGMGEPVVARMAVGALAVAHKAADEPVALVASAQMTLV